MNNATPLFKSLSDEALIENYLSYKQLAYNGAACKSRNVGKLLRNLDIIVAIGRKRGIQFPI